MGLVLSMQVEGLRVAYDSSSTGSDRPAHMCGLSAHNTNIYT